MYVVLGSSTENPSIIGDAQPWYPSSRSYGEGVTKCQENVIARNYWNHQKK